MINPLLSRIREKGKLEKVFVERLTEPFHLNVIAAGVAVLGNFRQKVDFDLVLRPQYAFPILRAADFAIEWGYKELTLIEFGVAAGAGLLNICKISDKVTEETGITFKVVGFDTGKGMPPPIDYRDTPEYFGEGDYPMQYEQLKKSLPENCQLIIGDISETLPAFLESVSKDAPIGFASIDVDYYSSAKVALEVFGGPPEKYLPLFPVYLDDIGDVAINPWVGEALAINEFNDEHPMRKIAPWNMLRARRIFKNPKWIEHIYGVHIHDHAIRTPGGRPAKLRVIQNEFIGVSFPSS